MAVDSPGENMKQYIDGGHFGGDIIDGKILSLVHRN